MKNLPIIFVDDDALYLRLVESIVAKEKVKAHYANSGEHALALLRTIRCAAMVTDLNMPGMDGYQLSELARELFPDLHITLVTGDVAAVVPRVAAEAGISKVACKPNCTDQVRQIIRDAVSARHVA
jgi:CheY-like chemotaxis protein